MNENSMQRQISEKIAKTELGHTKKCRQLTHAYIIPY